MLPGLHQSYGKMCRAVGPPGDAGAAEINVKVENLQPIKKAKRPSTLSFLALAGAD